MKYLKSINEDIHDTKSWIDEVMSNCKDIMIDIDDLLGTLKVVKDFSIEDREIIINCTFNILYDWSKSREYWRKMHKDVELILADVEPMLIDYMKSEGFTYNTYPLQTHNGGDSLNYKATFRKSLDNEFVGHLRYLKKYKIFESLSNEKEITEYLEDIFLEVEDMGLDVNIEPRYDYYREAYNEPGKVGGTRQVRFLNGFTILISSIDLIARYSIHKENKTFLLDDVYQYVETCESYLNSKGFFISNFDVGIPRYSVERHNLNYNIKHHRINNSYKLLEKDIVYLELTIGLKKEPI